MRAWIYDTTKGGLEKTMRLTTTDMPQPTLPKDGVLLKVRYASLNPVDYKMPELGIARFVVGKPPAVPGLDFSGVVVRVGEGVAKADEGYYREGMEVSGRLSPTKFGSLGEYIIAKPDGLVPLASATTAGPVSLAAASCGGTAALSAYQAIAPHVRAGDRVFIQGGSGGVGSLGIQIAAALGCVVSVSSSARNAGFCRSLGASEVVDYNAEDVGSWLRRQGRVFRLVVDAGPDPGDLWKGMDEWLLEGDGDARCVLVNTPLGLTVRQMLWGLVGWNAKRLVCYGCFNNREDLTSVIRLMAEGKLKVPYEEFAMEDGAKAMDKLKNGHPQGKIVVRVAEA